MANMLNPYTRTQHARTFIKNCCGVQKFHVVWKQLEADAVYQDRKAKHKLLEKQQPKAV